MSDPLGDILPHGVSSYRRRNLQDEDDEQQQRVLRKKVGFGCLLYKKERSHQIDEAGATTHCSHATKGCHEENNDANGDQKGRRAKVVRFHEDFETIVDRSDCGAY